MLMDWWRQYRVRKYSGLRSSVPKPSRWWHRLAYPFILLGKVPGWILGRMALSARVWIDRIARQRRLLRDLLLGAPAIIGGLAFVGATAVGHYKQGNSSQTYFVRGNQMLRSGDAKTAQIYLQKAMLGEKVSRRDVVFALARSYELTKDVVKADALMSSLASADTVGYPPAHRYLAIRIAVQVASTGTLDAEQLKVWHWHLTHSDQVKSPELKKSWGAYYLVTQDIPNAIKYFREGAEDEPALWLQVAELEARLNDVDAVRRTLATARTQLERQFLRDPGNSQNRLRYTTSLFYIGELPDAEKLLKEGLTSEDNQSFRQLLAAIFIRMYDVEAASDKGLEGAFQYLTMALDYDPGYQMALNRVVGYGRSGPEQLEASREAMRNLIATGKSSAMAHFALGTLEQIAGNSQLAQFNMKQAMSLDSKLSVVANNLAFLIADEPQGDLATALGLANQAVEADPKNSEFLDTRGFIYEKMGQFANATVDYQRALEGAQRPAELQLKLAEIYQKMGDNAMAEHFRKAAQTGNSEQ